MLTRRTLLGTLGAVLVIGLQLIAAETAPKTPKASAVSSQPVHPVLIRNDHGPLTRVVVDVANGAEARTTSFDFKLDGTDDVGDLESLTLFSTGDKDEFSPAAPFGEPAKPAATITFRGERVLNAGKNVFWLSCRLTPTADLAHRVAATCSSIETSVGKLTPRDDSPGARHRIGVAIRGSSSIGRQARCFVLPSG